MPYEETVRSLRRSRPPQFTLANMLRFMVALGIILAIARSLGSHAAATLAVNNVANRSPSLSAGATADFSAAASRCWTRGR
jgi:hypothetical protein